jgi:hypothetical protein
MWFRLTDTTFAPNFAVETTPIENWLELEVGVSPFYTRNAMEWDTGLLFKKLWTISPKAEFILGIGPQWSISARRGRPLTQSPVRWLVTSCSGQPTSTAVGSSSAASPGPHASADSQRLRTARHHTQWSSSARLRHTHAPQSRRYSQVKFLTGSSSETISQ